MDSFVESWIKKTKMRVAQDNDSSK